MLSKNTLTAVTLLFGFMATAEAGLTGNSISCRAKQPSAPTVVFDLKSKTIHELRPVDEDGLNSIKFVPIAQNVGYGLGKYADRQGLKDNVWLIANTDNGTKLEIAFNFAVKLIDPNLYYPMVAIYKSPNMDEQLILACESKELKSVPFPKKTDNTIGAAASVVLAQKKCFEEAMTPAMHQPSDNENLDKRGLLWTEFYAKYLKFLDRPVTEEGYKLPIGDKLVTDLFTALQDLQQPPLTQNDLSVNAVKAVDFCIDFAAALGPTLRSLVD